MARPKGKAGNHPLDFLDHLANLDHGQLAELLGDARLVELVSQVMQSRHDLEAKERGQIILGVAGGAESILEDSVKRRSFFLTLSGKQREELAEKMGAHDVDSFKLTSERRPGLYGFFGLTPSPKSAVILPPAVECVDVTYGLFAHQTDALLECLGFLESETPRVMLHMPTGAGKTRTAMHLICRHQNSRKTGVVLWLVAGKELCEQAADEFRKAWKVLGERPLPLISAWEGRRQINTASFEQCRELRGNDPKSFEPAIWPEGLNDALIVGSLDTIWEFLQKWQPGEIVRRASNVSLIVFDEAHRAAAKTYSQIVESIHGSSGCGLLGLSATPGRKHFGAAEDTTGSLVKLFGEQKVQLQIADFKSPVEALISQGYLAKLTKEQLKVADSGISKNDLAAL